MTSLEPTDSGPTDPEHLDPERTDPEHAAFARTATAFRDMAHAIVWASVATVDPDARPRTRILHPIWDWDGTDLTGWVATVPSPVKRADLDAHPHASVSYWTTSHDTCSADCHVQWHFDDETRKAVWDRFAHGPAPVGYDPFIIPQWAGGPTSDQFAVLRLTPYRLRVMPGTVLIAGEGEVLSWRDTTSDVAGTR